MKNIHNNNKISHCQYLKVRSHDTAPLCRLRQLQPVLSMYELGQYCKSKGLNTCPYLQHLSKLADKNSKDPVT